MAEVQELTAAADTITIGGKEYTRKPLTATDWGLIQKRILAQRPDVIEIARRLAQDAPEAIAKQLYEDAYRDASQARQVTAGEQETWQISLDGLMYQFWLQIRKVHRDVTLDKAAELLEQWTEEYLKDLILKLQEQFPDATEDQIVATAQANEDDAIKELIQRAAGLPAGNR